MHFHDSDETWIIMGGKGIAHMVDRAGNKSDFELEDGGSLKGRTNVDLL